MNFDLFRPNSGRGCSCCPSNASTVRVGKTITGPPGSDAFVSNSGSPCHAVLDFTIPQGDPGDTGPAGPAGASGPAGPPGPKGAAGPAGAAATIQIGTVTTGAPGSNASVTNSGTKQNAIFNFTIPRGEPGDTGPAGPPGSCPAPLEVLSAFSTPPQIAALNASLIFDRNTTAYGTAITHSNNSDSITIKQTGVYYAAFNGSFLPVSCTNFPSPLLVYMTLNGAAVNGSAVRHTFHTTTENVTLSFSQTFTVTAVPSVIRIQTNYSSVAYSDISLTIFKMGDVPAV